jgi:hypothetical protein
MTSAAKKSSLWRQNRHILHFFELVVEGFGRASFAEQQPFTKTEVTRTMKRK